MVEAFLDGEEASFFCLSDGKSLLPLATARRTTSVSATAIPARIPAAWAPISPAPVMTPEMVERTMKEIIEPTMRGMAEMGHPFQGVFLPG